MDQSKALTKLLRVLQFRKHMKELTSACKRINKDGCYEFVTAKSDVEPAEKRSCSKRRRRERQTVRTTSLPPSTVNPVDQPLEQMTDYDHLSHATIDQPVNLSMIVSQSYKPLHVKSSQFNKNTIAVSKGTSVKAQYMTSNWVFIQVVQTGQTGFVPLYCLEFPSSTFESTSQNNISLLNVSIYEKPHLSPNGRFVSSIGACQANIDQQTRPLQSDTFRRKKKDQSILSRQISNISLHVYDPDAYGTLNITPGKSFSVNVLDEDRTVIFRPTTRRLRAMESYEKQFVGDISVLESEVLTLIDSTKSIGDWHLVRRGDGRQGYVPKHILSVDQTLA